MASVSFIQHRDISVEIIRSPRRKTMALQIKNGAASIRMPKRLAKHYAESFVIEKYDWIKAKLAAQPTPSEKTFNDGEQLLFLGEALTITTKHGPRNQVKKLDNTLQIETKVIPADTEQKRKLLEKWYRQQAQSYLLTRTEILSQQCNLYPKKVSVRSYKARWGSCNIRGEIQLNWKLIMAPPAVIDYVIIHELCHLKQHNHSPAFWALVESFEPDYKKYRLWFKLYGHQLNL